MIRRERGSSALEYIVVLALAGLVVVALVGSGLRARSASAVQTAVCNLFSSEGCGEDVAGGSAAGGPAGDQSAGGGGGGGGSGSWDDDGGGGFWGGLRDAGGAFVDGLVRGDFNRGDRTDNGWIETSRGVGQFLSGVLIVGDIRDGASAVEEIWSSGGRDGWGNLVLSGVGLIPIAGDAVKGIKGGVRIVDDVAGAADDVPRPRNPADDLPTCLTNSFSPATRVLLADGTTLPIAEVDVGDTVLAADPLTGTAGARAVTHLIVGLGVKQLVDVTVGGDTLTATDGHPFYLPASAAWVPAGDLRPGDTLRTAAGAEAEVEAVREHRTFGVVHNLTVDDLHTYHVLAGDTPVLVHNASPCTPNERVDAIRANPNLIGGDRLDEIRRGAEAGDAGALGELDAIERSLGQGRTVEVLPEVQNAGRTNPDLRVDGRLTEVKTRDTPLNNRWIKDQIGDANTQVRGSGLPGANQGGVEVQLRGPAAGATDEQIRSQVQGAFTANRNSSLERVAVYRDGQLAGEWRRNADGSVTQIFPVR